MSLFILIIQNEQFDDAAKYVCTHKTKAQIGKVKSIGQ